MASCTYGPTNNLDTDAALKREELVLQHLPQVRLIATRIHDRLPDHICLDDLISTGILGLIAAIDNYDPSQNVLLKTYAEHRIYGAIMDGLRDTDWAPRDMRKKARTVEAAIHTIKQREGREPTEEEIADEMRISLADYHKLLGDVQSTELARLEYSQDNEAGVDLLKFISDDEESWPSHVVERAELERILALAIERMPKNERTVLSLYYYEELSLREIASVMGMHLSRIGQLRVQGILRLRSHLERVWMTVPGRKPDGK
jgi:RNA polymerase sigma factor for flagellar operon FliA